MICFRSEKQAKKKPALPPVIADTHDNGPVFSEDDDAPTGKKQRKKRAGTWNTPETGEVAKYL